MIKKVELPEGTKFGSYYITKSNSKFIILRHVTFPDGTKKTVGLKWSEYKHITSRAKLEEFVERLNGRANRRKIEAIKSKIAFIPTELSEDFRIQLEQEIPSQKDARNHYRNLHRYFLKFFVEILNLHDPLDWKLNEIKFEYRCE